MKKRCLGNGPQTTFRCTTSEGTSAYSLMGFLLNLYKRAQDIYKT